MSGIQWSISSGRQLQLTQRRTKRQREKCGNDKIKVSLEIEQMPESLITITNNMKICQGVKNRTGITGPNSTKKKLINTLVGAPEVTEGFGMKEQATHALPLIDTPELSRWRLSGQFHRDQCIQEPISWKLISKECLQKITRLSDLENSIRLESSGLLGSDCVLQGSLGLFPYYVAALQAMLLRGLNHFCFKGREQRRPVAQVGFKR